MKSRVYLAYVNEDGAIHPLTDIDEQNLTFKSKEGDACVSFGYGKACRLCEQFYDKGYPMMVLVIPKKIHFLCGKMLDSRIISE